MQFKDFCMNYIQNICFRILVIKSSHYYFILQYVISIYKSSALFFFPDVFLRIYNFGSMAVLLAIFGMLPANFKWQKRELFLELRDFF